MADTLSRESRTINMTAIRSTGMKPELSVRSMVHRMGFRFRLHSNDLPGKPDLVFRSRGKVIFVHGCFWHQHRKTKCLDGRLPKSNTSYWGEKLARNVKRDSLNVKALRKLGWKTLVIWECDAMKADAALERRIRQFLEA